MAIEFRENNCGTVIVIIKDGAHNSIYPYEDIEIPDGYEISINGALLTYEELEQIITKMKELQEK